jgi:hypothetical protein
MQPPGATIDVAAWRPQLFGRGNVKSVVDPLIEPHWDGDRVLVWVTLGDVPNVDIIDEDGTPIVDEAGISQEILAAARASSLVLDGYLTSQATRSSEGVWLGGPRPPSVGALTTQMLVGSAGQRRRQEMLDTFEHDRAGGPLAFVAVDLLAIDDQPILDAPLLERKRLLDGVLLESDLVRRTTFVRPPIDAWLGTWRSIGFRTLAYKAANGRYRPGQKNPGWARVTIPMR